MVLTNPLLGSRWNGPSPECPTYLRSREALAKKVMIERLTLNAAAAAFNVSRKTAAK
jgi:hypothetical protein